MPRIYLDYNASTPIAPEVRAAMAPFLAEHYGNPSSGHWASAPAKQALERARAQVAALLGAQPGEIVFTAGGSEANNHAIKGCWFDARRDPRRTRIVLSAVEHPAVVQPARFLERLGAEVAVVPVDRHARIDPAAVERELARGGVALVSIMHANNEVGTLQPIAEIGTLCRAAGVPFHTDAAQSVGKVPAKVDDLKVDLLSVAGHKLYAPKGVGALYIRGGVALEPLVHGAGHEAGRRAGTENVLLNVALGAACELAQAWLPRMNEVRALREQLWTGLNEIFGAKIVLNGHPEARLPNTLNVSFAGCTGAGVLAALDGAAATTGSACHSGSVKLSPVLEAMGVDPQIGRGAVRFSLGRETTPAEIAAVLSQLAGFANRPSAFGSNPD
ncbi:MAG: cysteine desulfurase [Planctomycetota bacterium]